ncbi:MAG TPA: MarR family transcriptional regulator [Terracidiphilus sp.]|nr:MarR family transcriptional regulator [Terracidiphilus sp.]
MSGGKRELSPVTVAFLLSQVGGRSAQLFAELLSPLHFVPSEAGILRLLEHTPGISQQELANRLRMHASRLVAIIDGLEGRGLIARETNAEDRRLYSLRLTPAGRESLAAIGRVARAHEEAMCEGLSETERAQLAGSLGKIAARHGLARGIHPGYRTLGATQANDCEPRQRRRKL